MPKAYVVLTETITDAEGMARYERASTGPIVQYGAKVLAVDPAPVVLEGDWPCTRTVMLQFDSVEQAHQWYDSPEYRAALPLRQAAARTNAVILHGFEMPGRG